MQIQIASDGHSKNTRIILIDESGGRHDISQIVHAVTWHLGSTEPMAKVILQCEGVMPADVQGILTLATAGRLSDEEIRDAFMEVPG